MYLYDSRKTEKKFSLLAQRARKAKKILRLKHENKWGYLLEEINHDKNPFRLDPRGNYEQTEAIDVFIDFLDPCCFRHALSQLEEEFLEINKQKYKQEYVGCEMRTYFVKGIEKVSEDSKKIAVIICCGT